MLRILGWAGVSMFLVLQNYSLAARGGKCWKSVKRRLLHPCDDPRSCDQKGAVVLSFETEARTDTTSEANCFSLKDFRVTINETLEIGSYLLKHERLKPQTSKHRQRKNKNKGQDLWIRLNATGRNLGYKQEKLSTDILQIVSFAHYVKNYSRSLEPCLENRDVNDKMQELEMKMMNVACMMSYILNNSTVTSIDTKPPKIPDALCGVKKKGKPQAGTHAVLSSIGDFFSGIRSAYNESLACTEEFNTSIFEEV